MKIAQKYSHLNGEEYLIVHHNDLYNEIIKKNNDGNTSIVINRGIQRTNKKC